MPAAARWTADIERAFRHDLLRQRTPIRVLLFMMLGVGLVISRVGPGEWTIATISLTFVLMVVVIGRSVLADSPYRERTDTYTSRFDPRAVLAAKLLLCGLIVGVGIVGQLLALSWMPVPFQTLLVALRQSAATWVSVVGFVALVALWAGRAWLIPLALLVLIFAQLATADWKSRAGPVHLLDAGLIRAIWIAAAVSSVVLAWCAFTGVRLRTVRALGVLCLMIFLLSPSPGTISPTVPRLSERNRPAIRVDISPAVSQANGRVSVASELALRSDGQSRHLMLERGTLELALPLETPTLLYLDARFGPRSPAVTAIVPNGIASRRVDADAPRDAVSANFEPSRGTVLSSPISGPVRMRARLVLLEESRASLVPTASSSAARPSRLGDVVDSSRTTGATNVRGAALTLWLHGTRLSTGGNASVDAGVGSPLLLRALMNGERGEAMALSVGSAYTNQVALVIPGAYASQYTAALRSRPSTDATQSAPDSAWFANSELVTARLVPVGYFDIDTTVIVGRLPVGSAECVSSPRCARALLPVAQVH